MISIKNTVLTPTALLLAGLLFAQPAAAEGDAERGAALGYTCLGCHGVEGYRNAYPSYRVPKLAGQKTTYLVIALQGYRDGSRPHPTMTAQAKSLTEQQIEDVAAYLASLGDEAVDEGGDNAQSFAPAEACAACHGPNGISVSPSWPTLAGQYESYLEHALKQYRSGLREDPVMGPLAANLSDREIELLAEYYSELEGLETTDLE